MTAKSPEEAAAGLLDWSPFAQQIVEDSQAALGFPYVVLARYDTVARTSRPVCIGGMQLKPNQRALELGQRLVPRFDLYRSYSVDANPLLRANFEGEGPLIGSVEEFTRGLVPPLIARIASHVAGAAYVIAIPLCVEHRVLGCLSFYQRSPHFSPAWIRTAQAFSRQVALSIHNAELLDEGRRTAAALEASRRLISEAEERTRRDISEFLHSRVQSRLLVAEYRLGEIEDVSEEARRRIEAVRAELEDLRERDVRQVSHQLHPEALRMGLVTALQLLATRLDGVLDVQLVADDTVLAAERSLTMPLRLVAFRVIEEALGNVLKHASADRATVWLGLEPHGLRLEVTDDGRGFEVGAQPPGLGLLCLGARVESMGGCWGIESVLGGPTRLWAQVPK
ncbi:GAF domain-containing protein [Deinococcus sp. Arct2-2]|uniref:GAF domain-containing sensor histidine kinase n=1 Tax=Deinococcus sp. Arct2-2 TaxID=2568653 RepID=UPI0010A3EA14|nr:GAF domain-containing protein [Deinococcus sp. Arct2-2]THF70346.1 GAF domain-containing protein [Deinococcus sp. Arct2-2]